MQDHGGVGINWAPLIINMNYFNLMHSPIQVDMKSFIFNFTTMVKDQTPVVFMQLPLIKEWAFDLDYKSQFVLFAQSGHMKVDLLNAYALATV